MNAKQEYAEAYRRIRIMNMDFDKSHDRAVNVTQKPVHMWILENARKSHFNGKYTEFK